MCVPGCFLIDRPDNQWNKPAFTETRPSFWKYSSQKSSCGIPRCGFSNSPVFQVEEILGFILGRGSELLGANDLFTAFVCNLFWLVGAMTCPLTDRILSIWCVFTDVMSLISDGAATLRQTSDKAPSPAGNMSLFCGCSLRWLGGGEQLLSAMNIKTKYFLYKTFEAH